MVEPVLEIGKGESKKNGPGAVCEFTIVNMDPKVKCLIYKRNKFVQIVTCNIKLLPVSNSKESM